MRKYIARSWLAGWLVGWLGWLFVTLMVFCGSGVIMLQDLGTPMARLASHMETFSSILAGWLVGWVVFSLILIGFREFVVIMLL